MFMNNGYCCLGIIIIWYTNSVVKQNIFTVVKHHLQCEDWGNCGQTTELSLQQKRTPVQHFREDFKFCHRFCT